jgi:Zn-dependent oligopeptidase
LKVGFCFSFEQKVKLRFYLYIVEEKNFALFNYVNEMNNQIEILQEQMEDVKKEIRRFERQGIELEEKQQTMLEEINEKRSQTIAIATEHEEKIHATRKILDQCRAGQQSLLLTSFN